MAIPIWAKTIAIIAPCVLVLSGAAFLLKGALDVPTHGIIGDGFYPLTVKVQHSGKKRIAKVVTGLQGKVEVAQETLKLLLDPRFDLRQVDAIITSDLWSLNKCDPFDGEPLQLDVPFSQHTRYSIVGRVCSDRYVHFRGLVVFAVMEDGQRVGKVEEIPDMHESREVIVTLP